MHCLAFFTGENFQNTAILENMLQPSLKQIDFSGLGAFHFWRDVTEGTYKIRRTKSMSVDTRREFVFHAVWGTKRRT